MSAYLPLAHEPSLTRRAAVQAGAVGLLGLGMNHLTGLQALAHESKSARPEAKAKAVIYIFLSGGLSQIDSFDPKPNAPESIRGEFKPIATSTPGIHVCEHLPLLAERSHRWSVVRSLAHPQPEHSAGHLLMLTGQSMLPPGFDPNQPKPSDWPSIAAIANTVTRPRNNLPPAVVLPEVLIHRTGRVIPGQFAGTMGSHWDPLFLQYCRYSATMYGAYPTYAFHHSTGKMKLDDFAFQAPNLKLPSGVDPSRFNQRLDLLASIGKQRENLERAAANDAFDRHHQKAVSLLADPKAQRAFDVSGADDKTLDRYGRNTFGWSLLVARQLVEAGVNLVQVNLGNNETWDTHGNIFDHLKTFLLPPTDRAVSALIDDLHERGLLDQTLIVMAGEMGRTPRMQGGMSAVYAKPGRDHWGTQSVFLAGGGVRGGNVVGATDKIGAYPAANPQKPENLGATIYEALGLPRTLKWHDASNRPHFVYHADPIAGLTG